MGGIETTCCNGDGTVPVPLALSNNTTNIAQFCKVFSFPSFPPIQIQLGKAGPSGTPALGRGKFVRLLLSPPTKVSFEHMFSSHTVCLFNIINRTHETH